MNGGVKLSVDKGLTGPRRLTCCDLGWSPEYLSTMGKRTNIVRSVVARFKGKGKDNVKDGPSSEAQTPEHNQKPVTIPTEKFMPKDSMPPNQVGGELPSENSVPDMADVNWTGMPTADQYVKCSCIIVDHI
jgi:hypothetical protein